MCCLSKYRRSWTPVQGEFQKPIKRLFTPEIKRMLKDWLVRRRENPYPSRDEKKSLAQKTGLTYIQVLNKVDNSKICKFIRLSSFFT